MPNRQERRHPTKMKALPAPTGTMLSKLEQPVWAADLTVVEANEIKARNEEMTFLDEKLKELGEQQLHFGRLRGILINEKQNFIRRLCDAKGLESTDEFTCDLDQGVIMRTAVQVPMAPVEEVLDVVEAEKPVENGAKPESSPQE